VPTALRTVPAALLAAAALLVTGCAAGAGAGPAATSQAPAPGSAAAPVSPAPAGSAPSAQGSGQQDQGSQQNQQGGQGQHSSQHQGGQQGHNGQTSQNGQPASASHPLAGQVVGIDPGHNGGNFSDPAAMARQIWNGRSMEDCDTTGTETDAGYTEARFTFRVAGFLRRDLRQAGARVVMTRHTNTGVGPCVDRRSQILNHAHASVSIDIHGDGGPPGGRGFAILLPVADGPNNHVIKSSARFGRVLKRAFLAGTRMPVSDYDGVAGFQPRDDLAGLNLTTEPKVLIEAGNMRNAADASMMISTSFQRNAARAMAKAIIAFLARR
jgi:N-acetylmuramoyl-L-alanine amidase